MSSHSRKQLEEFLSHITPVGSVLDIGGSQNPIRKRVKTWENVTRYIIMDLEIPHEKKAEVDWVQDIQSLEFTKETKGLFDTIFCIEVSEYWIDPKIAIENIYNLLHKNGKAYISFHFVYPIHQPVEEDSLRYTKNGAKRLLEEAGFIIENIFERKFRDYNFYRAFTNNEGMRGIGGDEQGYLFEVSKN